MNEEAPEYVHDLDLFVTVQFYHLESYAKSTATLMSGSVVESHIWPRWEENPLQHSEFRSIGSLWTVIEFQQKLLFDVTSAGFINIIESSKFTK